MTTISFVADFLKIAHSTYFSEQRGRWVFRGHLDFSHELIPSVGRGSHTSSTRNKYEKSLFEVFCREAPSHVSPFPTNPWERLSIAQHHLLPTRLLDWSQNPMTALYFAVAYGEQENTDAALFALFSTTKTSATSVAERSPFEVPKPTKFYPSFVSPRIRAQEGLFVVCPDVEKPLDQQLPEGWRLEKLKIPANSKKQIRYELFRLGVHASSLFPDLDRLAQRLKWQHAVSPLQTN